MMNSYVVVFYAQGPSHTTGRQCRLSFYRKTVLATLSTDKEDQHSNSRHQPKVNNKKNIR